MNNEKLSSADCTRVIQHFERLREEALTRELAGRIQTEAQEAYEMTTDPLVGRFLQSRGHHIRLDQRGNFDRGQVADAILAECSDRTEKAYGYADLAKEGSGPWVKFHTFCEGYYAWRDGDLDQGAA